MSGRTRIRISLPREGAVRLKKLLDKLTTEEISTLLQVPVVNITYVGLDGREAEPDIERDRR